MVLRGLKSLISKAPGKLVRARAYTAYRAIGASGKPHGPNLRGVARRLGETIFSAGELSIAPSSRFKGKTWSGPDGGIRRGKAVDAQVSRLAKASAAARAISADTMACVRSVGRASTSPVARPRMMRTAASARVGCVEPAAL